MSACRCWLPPSRSPAAAAGVPPPRRSRRTGVCGGLCPRRYHAGAEWGFWAGPADCGGGAAPTLDAGDLLGQMRATRLVSCTEASVRLLGLSFAGWNAVVCLAVAALGLYAALAPGRRMR
ncbi:disulfide bond formation protein B [Methylobrevis pamukkalensis]|nr:disulfide bond formation protein B [Methylobrevis pamukkalensis]